MTAKRTVDLAASLAGLLLLSPLLAAIGILIRISDGKPVFFGQTRVGLHGRHFTMWKFRTMVHGAEKAGGSITVGGDGRITRLGQILRSTKLDELPQLANVIRGEMSLVGPRPEVPQYVAYYRPHERRVLSLVPGITNPASVAYRREADMLAASDDPDRLYREVILPDKIRMNLEYAEGATVVSDLKVIVRTLLPWDA